VSTGSHRFRQRELTRILLAMQAAEVEVERIEIDTNGKIIVIPKGNKPPTGWEEFK
jgi:hypothetical protein